jgi:hypothetical protein
MRHYVPLLIAVLAFPVWGVGLLVLNSGRKPEAFWIFVAVLCVASLAVALDWLEGKKSAALRGQ